MVRCLCIFLLMTPSTFGITLTGSSSSATVGQRFQFTCTVTGSSTAQTLAFERNDRSVCTVNLNSCQQLRATPGYNCSCGQTGVYHMDITSVSLADGGIWTCTRSKTSDKVRLTVNYGPFNNVTLDEVSPMAVIEDVAVSLTARCSAVCNPGCSYTWSKGTQQVFGNRDLPVGSFRRGQEGVYRCTARNTATGVTAHSQTLIVNVQWYPAPPSHNCPSLIVPGQTNICTCQTSDRGNPAGSVQWISPGGLMVPSSGPSSGQLNLTSITRSNKGLNYICRANNSLPGSNSDVTYVARIAYFENPQLTFDKEDAHGNTPVTVTCTVESNPRAKMTVENIGSEEKPASGITNNLTLTTTTRCLHNRFRCTAENNQTNTRASTVRQLNVACLPQHDASKHTNSMVTGQLKTSVSLVANVIASPVPNFTWFHHQEMTPVPVVVGTGGHVVFTEGLQSVLRVYINREEDYGIYRVVVQNRVGSTSLFFSLTKDVSPPATSGNIVSVAVGMGAVILILTVVLLYSRGFCKRPGLPESNGDEANGEYVEGLQQNASSQHGRAVDGALPTEKDTYPNAYSGVYEIEADKQTYTELKEFEATNDSTTQGNSTYEGLQARAPPVYEDMSK